ncbi:uncharacterized protein [Gossypium hirsutum]|uniref:Uncharacterized protein n=1 Tax=Gossypium hirsutum TaxID=3635 RepID=A0A1U8PJ99_GOSHI|nr:uncharacterized protein LOC107958955 [Gossypium hirsutum]
MRVNKLFEDVPLEVQGMIFLADLMKLPFEEFDIILGMDWLVKHQENLNCAAKRVKLRTEKGDKKLARKGCEACLAYVSASGSEVSSVKDIRTVKDFRNVFLDELLRLPPNREVEFGMEIFSGTAPVSIAPYSMAL